MPNIVILDGYTLNPGDLSWDELRALGDCQIHERTPEQARYERSKEADILIVNKVKLDKALLSKLTRLKYVCVSATGYNNLDIAAMRQLGIQASNVKGYSKESVTQHVFAIVLSVLNQPHIYHREVADNGWARSPDWSYWHGSINELKDMVMGIYGFGQIGQYVGQIARAFHMEVIALHKHPERDKREWVQFVDAETLFRRSDVLTLHAPLASGNRHFVDSEKLGWMKRTSILVNTARGGLIDEEALYWCLKKGKIRAACLDVLSSEPPGIDHPLTTLRNCHITPHQAWASKESRQRLMDGVVSNVRSYLSGEPLNLVTQGS